MMKKLLVICLLLGSQVDCTSPNFRKNHTKNQLKTRAQHNTYCQSRKRIEEIEAACAKKNDTSILSNIKNYTQEQKIATGLGAMLLGSGLVQGYWGYQALTQEASPRMIVAAFWAGLGVIDLLRGQNFIVNAYGNKEWHAIMRPHIK